MDAQLAGGYADGYAAGYAARYAARGRIRGRMRGPCSHGERTEFRRESGTATAKSCSFSLKNAVNSFPSFLPLPSPGGGRASEAKRWDRGHLRRRRDSKRGSAQA